MAVINGTAGNDPLTGTASADTLNGLDGNDALVGNGGADIFNGGNGTDTANYRGDSADASVTVNLGTNVGGGGAAGDTWNSVENVQGSRFADTIIGDVANNVLTGNEGDDTLRGGAGDDTLLGGSAQGADGGGAFGNDTLDGGDGIDTVNYRGDDGGGVGINLLTGAVGGIAQGDTLISIENVSGTRFADTLVGDAGNNVFQGNEGDDILNGGAGDDTLIGYSAQGADGGGQFGNDQLNGGDGNDTVDYSQEAQLQGVGINLTTGVTGGQAAGDTLTSIENVTGTTFGDNISGDAGANVLNGHDGDDVLEGGQGADTLIGGAGTDLAAYGGTAGVTVDLVTGTGSGGSAEGDTLSGIENLNGTAFDDTLIGAAGANALNGGTGNDMLSGGAGADQLNGEGGSDTVDYSLETQVQGVGINLTTGVTGGQATGDTLTSIENVTGTTFGDNISGDAGANVLNGHDGDDVLEGGQGGDTLIGGAGTDLAAYGGTAGVTVDLVAGTGSGGSAEGDTLSGIENLNGTTFDDTLIGAAGANTLNGGAGNDVLVGGAGADNLDGGAGTDTVRYNTSDTAVTVDLGAGTGTGGHAEGDQLASIENLGGSAFDDTLTGAAGANLIAGGGGDDTLAGAGGNDTLLGGNGTDALDGGDGWDTLEGEAGDDQLTGGASGDILRGGAGADHLSGGADYDTASYWDSTVGVTINLETGVNTGGTAQGDTIDNDVELINGSNHDDVMTGNALSNGLIGFDGDDTLSGGGGGDVLRGGSGADTLNGGSSNDMFSYTAVSDSTASAADTIQDFLSGTDVISVQAIDADGNAANGDTAFSFIGTAAFSSTAGQLRYESAGDSTTVSADVNGDGTADLVIHLDGALTLQASDFLL